MDVEMPQPQRPGGPASHAGSPAGARARLLWRIAGRYRTSTEEILVGPLRIPFTRIADPNAVLEEAAEAESREQRPREVGEELHLPYWAEVWDSSHGMGCYYVRQWSQPAGDEGAIAGLARRLLHRGRGAKVLDLGCGMGLAGAVAARLGAYVTFADLEAPALLFARLNSLANAARCRYRRLNWRCDRLPGRFDLILGADILYDRRQWEAQEAFFGRHLAEGGTVVLGEPGRPTGDEYPGWIRGRGWELREFAEPRPGGRRIRIFELQPMEQACQ